MKKRIYYFISILIIIFFTIILFEILLQSIPIVYRNLPTNNEKIYVYSLGESSAYGVPYSGKISYAKILKYIANNEIDNKKIELIVLAKPGEKLFHQYIRYLIYKYMHPLQRGIVLLYAGTNDYADIKDEYINQKFILSGLLNNIIYGVKNFKYEYERIILLANKFDDDIYMSTIAGNYAGFMPGNISQFENNEFKKEIDNIDYLFLKEQYKQSFIQCDKILNKYDNAKAHIYYRIGKIYEKQNNIKEANNFYLKANEEKKADAIRIRPTIYQNNIIKEIAKKHDIPIVDIFNELYNSREIIGYNFFIDKIHPRIRTNIIIAKGFIGLLSKKYNIAVNKDITEEEIKKVENFKNIDMIHAYMCALGEIFLGLCRFGIIDMYNTNIIEKYILKMKEIEVEPDEEKQKLLYINTCELVFTAMFKNKKNSVQYLRQVIDKINEVVQKHKKNCLCHFCIIKKIFTIEKIKLLECQ
ncbi:MAG: hypothetical protein PHH62_01265 [Endomicrobiaceae bacterium]|nr:hypothetical protein [Endomicrobiaceae bacterium]